MMPEYGDYKKEIKTLGDLRTFVNETLKDIEDDYTFDIDDDFMGIDIILTANCDVSYSGKSFYWTANVNCVTDVKKSIEDIIKTKHKIKAWDIGVKKDVDLFMLRRFKTLKAYNDYARENQMIELTEEEFKILKEVLE